MSTGYSFTPVRRREETLRTQTHSSGDATSWTASRCSRLLRPIRSRIETLRKSQDLIRQVRRYEHEPAQSSQHKTLTIPTIPNSSGSDYDVTDEDKDWGPSRKKARRTYAGLPRTRSEPELQRKKGPWGYRRVVSTDRQAPMPKVGEIVIPTPILARFRDHAVGISQDVPSVESCRTQNTKKAHPRYVTKDGAAHHQLAEDMKCLRAETDRSTFVLYEGIYNALETLLRATNQHPLETLSGEPKPGSLFATCLRNLPERIRQEEMWMEDHAEEQGIGSIAEMPDVSAEMYSQLEGLGSNSSGWKHLRVVVRAHGIQTIGDAISQQLFCSRLVKSLIMLCVHMGSHKEAEDLLDHYLQQAEFPEPKTARSTFDGSKAMLPMLILKTYTNYTGRSDFLFRQLSRLFQTDSLPVSWLITKEFSCIWTNLVQRISSDPPSMASMELLKLTLSKMAIESSMKRSLFSPIISTAFQSVLVILVSATMSRELPPGRASSTQGEQLHTSTDILASTMIDQGLFTLKASSRQDILLAASYIICSLTGDQRKVAMSIHRHAWRRMLESTNKTGVRAQVDFPAFICAIARGGGRVRGDIGFDHLQLCLDRLALSAVRHATANYKDCRQLAVDSAYSFAQRSGVRAHLEYAELLGTQMYGLNQGDRDTTGTTIYCNVTDPPCRWEEGIGEWVGATPALRTFTSSTERKGMPQQESPSKYRLQNGHLAATKFSKVTRARIGGIHRPRNCHRLPDALTDGVAKDNEKSSSHPHKHKGQASTITAQTPTNPIIKTSKRSRASVNYAEESSDEPDEPPSLIHYDSDSDDELSFVSNFSITENRRSVIQPVSKKRVRSDQSSLKRSTSTLKKPASVSLTCLLQDSEDELSAL